MKAIFLALIVTFVGWTAAAAATAKNKTITAGGFSIDVQGKSGKIALKNGDKQILQITPDYLGEKTAEGEKAGKHELQNFAKTDFTFSDPASGKRYGLNTTTIIFNTEFTKDIMGHMEIETIVFEEAGEIEVESGELFNVTVGAIKFNVNITDYKFCNPCKIGNKNSIGKYLDFVMEIKGRKDKVKKAKKQKGKKGKSKAKKDPETYYLGDSEVILSHLVKVDGMWKNMSDTFPKMEQNGKKTSFTFRFPHFNSSIFYDPIGQESSESNTTEATESTIATGKFTVDILGKSGKISLSKDGKKILHITPDKFEEIDASGNTAGKHILQNFAQTDFTISTTKSEKRYGLDAKVIVLSTTFDKDIDGEMIIETIIFTQDGQITVESNETFKVIAGAIKFNVHLKNYKFDTNGKHILLSMEIKGTKSEKPEKSKVQKGGKGDSVATNEPVTYGLGNSDVTISSLIRVDDKWENMASPPEVNTKGSKTVFVFNFPKFSDNLFYDPCANPVSDDNDKNGSMTVASQSLFLIVTSVVACLYAYF